MKSIFSVAFSAVVLISVSQVAMASANIKKVVRTDHVSFTQIAPKSVQKSDHVQRTDRIRFHLPEMEQPSLQQKRIKRTDRITVLKN